MMKSNRCVAGFHLLPLLDKSKDMVKEAMGELFKLFKEGKIKPRIDSEWALEEVSEPEILIYESYMNVFELEISCLPSGIVENEKYN